MDWDILELQEKLEKEDSFKKIVFERCNEKLEDALQYYYECTLGFNDSLTEMLLIFADEFGIELNKFYCTDCKYVFYHDMINFEDMDCNNPYALPENGAPERISSELHNCPYYEERMS